MDFRIKKKRGFSINNMDFNFRIEIRRKQEIFK